MPLLKNAIPSDIILAARILIVDDNPTNVMLLEDILDDEGYKNVQSVTDPRAVKGLVETVSFDLMFLDINMPHLSGFDILDQLGSLPGADYLPVLVLTAQNDQDTRVKALDMGAMDFITKPFDVTEVLNRLTNTLIVRMLHKRAEALAQKIGCYLPTQVFESILKGEKDVALTTERKKLTIIFSDIANFTQTTDDIEPEDLTGLLNDYFTEMSAIAREHGVTIDKFIGDAILMFVGDPQSNGDKADAIAAVRTAIAMQEKMKTLNVKWKAQGFKEPFGIRVGINTGYCNVGNFGSVDRMDYTIIGGEVNIAARLEGTAKTGGIMITYDTYALVQDIIEATECPPIHVKGIKKEIYPYAIVGLKETDDKAPVNMNNMIADLHLETLSVDEKAKALQSLKDIIENMERSD
ncbi:MAG: response regulator [Magnetovibrio sp.]|nr:response regulator [Magnetovibrio sp.]